MKNFIKKILIKLKLIKDPKVKERRHSMVGAGKRWKIKQMFQIKFLKDIGLKKEDTFLDIGCGTLRGGIPIIKFLEAKKYYGIDIRKEVIDEAKKELKEENLQNKIGGLELFNQFNELSLNIEFDKIFAFSVLIHMKDDKLDECLNFVSKNLKSTGEFYANVNIGNIKDLGWLEFPVMFKSLEFYEIVAKRNNLKVEVIDELQNLGHVTNDSLSDKQLMLKFCKS
jgi:SAM-dependent methyltransferase